MLIDVDGKPPESDDELFDAGTLPEPLPQSGSKSQSPVNTHSPHRQSTHPTVPAKYAIPSRLTTVTLRPLSTSPPAPSECQIDAVAEGRVAVFQLH